MNDLFKKIALLLLLFAFAFQFETNAQIHDIKTKSKSNKSSSSSSSDSYSSSSDSGNDIASECIGGCFSELFTSLLEGCISGLFSGGSKNDDNDDFIVNGDLNKDYAYEESKTKITNEELLPIDTTENEIEPEIAKNIIEEPKTELTAPIKDNKETNDIINEPIEVFEAEKDFSLDLKPQFDLGFHKGIDKNYTYVDYLPGLRANLHFLSIDFRYNILTEYTDDFPDSFKSWELLLIANMTPNQDFKVLLGAGLQREIWDEPVNFTEFYLGTQIPFSNSKDYFDADTRFSYDSETEMFPSFEIGGRYNMQFLNFEHLSGYITLGATYQNYYQSHDIWALRGGVIINIH